MGRTAEDRRPEEGTPVGDTPAVGILVEDIPVADKRP